MKATALGACLLVATAASAEEPAPLPPQPEPEALRSLFGAEYDRALAAAGLDRASARCTPADLSLIGVGRFQGDLYKALQAEPTLADRYARTIRETAFASAGKLETASAFAAARAGAIVRISLLGDPLKDEVAEAQKPGALEAVLKEFGLAEVPSAAEIPPRVQAAAALILRAVKRAEDPLARAGIPSPWAPNWRPGVHRVPAEAPLLLLDEKDDPVRRSEFEKEAATRDLNHLARAAAELAVAVDRATAWLAEEAPTGPFEFRARIRGCGVLLRGGADDADGESEMEPFLLRIDTGGNDAYLGGAAASMHCPFSVLIDVSGNDRYESATSAFGSAAPGVGILVDLAGNDRYRLRGPGSFGLGVGIFGVGLLLDVAGDDFYAANDLAQGAGIVGWGALCDLEGKDRYEAYRFSQGFGFVRGAGVLTDLAGDDEFILWEEEMGGFAGDRAIRHPSAQSRKHGDSLGQGFGFGLRADYLDGHSLAGGVGILADREGNDSYSCGVFGQGAGYWMGVGMLLDGAGADSYTGAWYVQGACAHFAIGILDDGGGDDRYTAALNMAQGAGHDYSIGVLLDRGGNDRYDAPNLSLGGGNAQGIGLFVDAAGDDEYRSRGTTLGLANADLKPEIPTLRHGSLTLGLFLDLGGKDSFLDGEGKPWPFAGDGILWRQVERAGKAPHSNARGVGFDR